MSEDHLSTANAALQALLGPELVQIVDAIRDPNNERYRVILPEKFAVDTDVLDLLSLVARTSNIHYDMERLAGLAHGQMVLCESVYKKKYKSNFTGSSDKEREKNATVASMEEAQHLATAEAIFRMASGLASAARVSSESARKIADKVANMSTATGRAERGSLKDEDFNTW